MDLDKILIELSSIKVEPLLSLYDIPNSIMFLLKTVKSEVFVYHQKNEIVYFSPNLYACYQEEDGNLLNFLQRIYPKSQHFQIFSGIVTASREEKSFEFQALDQQWVRLEFSYDGDYTYGLVLNITEEKIHELAIHNQNLRLYKVFNSMPIPICFYNNSGDVEFKNIGNFKDHDKIYHYIEATLNENTYIKSDWIDVFEIMSDDDYHKKFRVSFTVSNHQTIIIVHRIMIRVDDDFSGKLYIYEDVTESYANQSKMHKILQTNELTMAIKDKVDEINDINLLYDFFLPRIPLVIPSVKRACVLRVVDKDFIEIAAEHGFEDSYYDNFKIRLETSFAGKSLNNDYSKSVIINDIQERFSLNHPEMNKNQKGFVLKSNISAPIILKGKLYGILSIDSDINNTFDDVDLYLVDYIRLQVERSIIKYHDYSKVKRNSILDPLTGVYNRRHLETLFKNYLQEAEVTHIQFSLVIFDIDDLKLINDHYGHLAGDLIIKKFAKFTSEDIRMTDTISRFGGDEFVGLFSNIPLSVLEKKIKAWKIDLMQEPISYNQADILVKFSYGIATYPDHGKSFKDLLDFADKKMYLMKQKK